MNQIVLIALRRPYTRHQNQADRLDRPDECVTAADRAFLRDPDQAVRQRVHLSARRRHGAAHGPGATERGTGEGQTDRHDRRDEEHGGLDPGGGRWDQGGDSARRASLPEGREDQAPLRSPLNVPLPTAPS